jgi:hypothetical protein
VARRGAIPGRNAEVNNRFDLEFRWRRLGRGLPEALRLDGVEGCIRCEGWAIGGHKYQQRCGDNEYFRPGEISHKKI